MEVSYKTGKPEMQFRVKHEEAAGLGVSPLAVAATVRAAFKGVEVVPLPARETIPGT